MHENRERSRAIKAAYELRHPEKAKAFKREWYERNREESIRRATEAKRADPERVRRLYREQYAKDPTPFIVRGKRRKERDAAVGGEFTSEDRSQLFAAQSGLCANPFCRADLAVTGFHADHKTPVVSGGSHAIGNRQLLCPTCNHRKGTLTNEQWLAQQRELSA